ncbi:MAG: hypothetical protein ACR2PG_15725 [Hyphomicrobiaceae bacterium]
MAAEKQSGAGVRVEAANAADVADVADVAAEEGADRGLALP